jgi:pimeloyl-ACP methyl ester carboxylesterase
MVRSILLYGLIALLVIAAGAVAISYPRYRAAVEAGLQVLDGGVIVTTERGEIEYAETGSGPPVLLIHGAGGGYDQGLLIGRVFVGDGFRIVAPSRFGYLKSPVPQAATPADQADLFAALLDTLGIDRAAVVAVSDGGPSALQFVLRHAQRAAALVMISAKSMTPPPSPPLMEPAFGTIFRSDYIFWAITTAAQSRLMSLFGVSDDVQQQASPGARQFASRFLTSMNPVGLRRSGIVNDRATMSNLPEEDFRLEEIAVPTLVVHAEDDGLQPYAHGVNTASRIAGTEFLSYARGGHMLLLQQDDVRAKVDAFLQAHAPAG